MKIRLAVFAAIVLSLTSQDANADSYYRINMRAYRRMMHFQGPHPLADRFWNFIDNRVLNNDGLLDRIIKEVLKQNNLANANQPAADGSMVAQRAVVQDQDLLSADAKVRTMAQKHGITYVEIPQTPSSTPQPNTPISGGVDTAVVVPQGFQGPAAGPAQAPR